MVSRPSNILAARLNGTENRPKMPCYLANVGSLVKYLRLLSSALLLVTAGCASQYWQFVGHMTMPRVGHTATRLNDGRVLVVGGYNKDNGVLASAEIFDPTTQTWSLTGSMHIARFKHTATLLQDGTVLVVGGLQNVGLPPLHGTNTAERYDPASGTWAVVKAMRTPRAFHLSSLLPDGTVLVVGGGPTGNMDDQLAAERFYPDGNSWVGAGSTRLAHTRGTATLLTTGFVLVSGGVGYGSEAEKPTEYVTGYSETYDWQSNSWSQLAVMGHTTFDHAAALLNDGTVLVMGGRLVPTLATAVRYDPKMANGNPYPSVWNSTSSLSQRRTNHQATVLPSGDILVTGGHFDCTDTTDPPSCAGSSISVEIYHPTPGSSVEGTWMAAEDMFNYRGEHTATLLQNGTVLVTGGYNWYAQSVGDSTEIYWPQGRPK